MSEQMKYKCNNTEFQCLCKLSQVFQFLSSKWILEILSIFGNNHRLRFYEIEGYFIGISPTTLTRRLKELTEEGYISKMTYDERPPRIEYYLTEKGFNLWDKLQPLLND
ncbi:MAG: winged helix-turn-helix transcriptional regulator [Candidatus Kariarchaeaceae archaeon]|jgi:DNA-binding HxlR family transcriptional regulator